MATTPCFSTELISKTFIHADEHPDAAKPNILPISNFDRLSGRYPVTVFYAYRRPSSGDFASIVAAMKSSLSNILRFFPPFAGRIISNLKSGDAEILCNNAGVELIVAFADISLDSIQFHDLDSSIKPSMIPFDREVPLSVQLTGYTCGGFSITWNYDHLIADGAAFVRFLATWSELARTNLISVLPINDRSILPALPTNGVASLLLDRIFTECTIEQILACPPNSTIRRLYYVEGACIDSLRQRAGGKMRTRTESVSAHLWKLLAGTLDGATVCKMGWLVDGRPRMNTPGMSSYVGNVVSMAVAEASAAELEEGSLSDVAVIVSQTIKEVANEAHFTELQGWIEQHRSAPVLAKILLGSEGPAIVVSSCHHMPAMETDFGFGAPLFGTFYTTLETLGAGYFNLFPTGREDGSWLVFAFVSPGFAAVMESDPDRVFQPVTAQHLGL